MDAKLSEQNKIKQVARDYEKMGYTVKIEPRGDALPVFIENYDPDLIAFNEKEYVVIEIKTKDDIETLKKLQPIADVINKNEGWRFELFVINPKSNRETSHRALTESIQFNQIDTKISGISNLINLKMYTAAFILCWSYLESISRQLLANDKKRFSNNNSLVLIKTLVSFGHVSHEDFDSLNELFQIRNKVVHGFEDHNLNKRTTERLLNLVKKIAKENYVDQIV